MSIEQVWIIAEKTTGPAGHGEPGMDHISLLSVAQSSYHPCQPAPAFTTEKAAMEFIALLDNWKQFRAVAVRLEVVR